MAKGHSVALGLWLTYSNGLTSLGHFLGLFLGLSINFLHLLSPCRCLQCEPSHIITTYSAYHTDSVRKHWLRHHKVMCMLCTALAGPWKSRSSKDHVTGLRAYFFCQPLSSNNLVGQTWAASSLLPYT